MSPVTLSREASEETLRWTQSRIQHHNLVSHAGRSSASGVRPSAIAIADQGTGTSDVAQSGSEEHNDDDVAMDGDGADDDSARHPNPSGSDSRRRITTKREPREVRVEQSGTTGQHVWRRLFGKTTHQRPAVAVTTQEALDGSREKTMRIANVENNALNSVSISSGRALEMTHCDFSGRPARDEMRHIIGSSEPDVIGLTGIGTGVQKEGQGSHRIFCASCTRHRLRAVDTSCMS